MVSGEIACINFNGLLDLDRKHLMNGKRLTAATASAWLVERRPRLLSGTLHYYFYHSIFDIAGLAISCRMIHVIACLRLVAVVPQTDVFLGEGAGCNEKFIFPIAIQPVYMGFTAVLASDGLRWAHAALSGRQTADHEAMDDLISKLVDNPKIDDRMLAELEERASEKASHAARRRDMKALQAEDPLFQFLVHQLQKGISRLRGGTLFGLMSCYITVSLLLRRSLPQCARARCQSEKALPLWCQDLSHFVAELALAGVLP